MTALPLVERHDMTLSKMIGSIFNNAKAIPPGTIGTQAPEAPRTVQRDSATGRPIISSATPPAPALNRLQSKFCGKEYFPSGQFSGGRFYAPNHPAITPQIFAAIRERAGELISAADADRLRKLRAEFARLQNTIQAHSFLRAGEIFRKNLEPLRQQISAGAEIRPFTSRDETIGQISAIRKEAHEILRAIITETRTIMTPACEKLAAAAYQLADEQDTVERGNAARYNMPFQPSPILKAFAWFGISTAFAPLDGFCCPPDPGRLQTCWLGGDKITTAIDSQKAAIDERITSAVTADTSRRKEQQAAADAAEAVRHKALVEKLNAEHDAIRLQSPAGVSSTATATPPPPPPA